MNEIHYFDLGEGALRVYWGHGWGQDHRAFLPLAETLGAMGSHTLIDFQGFGQSPLPPADWGSAEYADAIADFIRARTDKKLLWIGHSFGCRVGLQLAARHPDLLKGMVLIAGAGLKRRRPLWHKLYYGARIKLFKALKKLIPLGVSKEWLYTKFGSADYRTSGALRQTLIKVVNEDLSPQAAQTSCPTLLIYGSDDTETPPEIGYRLAQLIPHAKMIELAGFDHYTILSDARHQLAKRIMDFSKDLTDD